MHSEALQPNATRQLSSADLKSLLLCGTATLLLTHGVLAKAQARSLGTATTPPVQLPLSGRQGGSVLVQQSAPAPSGAAGQVQVQISGAFEGSVPSGEAVPIKLELSLSEAIRRGLRSNLGIVMSGLVARQAEVQITQAKGSLLPSINASVSENAAKVNLAAEGFSASAFGGGIGFQFPSTVGPFHYYDAHAAVEQSLLDVTALRNLRVQRKEGQASVLQIRQAREEVVLAVTGVYLQLMADLALLDRQRAEVTFAEASYQQANAQAEAGNKAPIEASRSLVEAQTEKQRLVAQAGEVRKRQIRLARLIGLPLTTEMLPTNLLTPMDPIMPSLEGAVETALAQRQDLKASELQVQAAEEARRAASAQRLPTATLNGTYGVQGTDPNQGETVFQATAGISIPIYQGGRIAADVKQADTVLDQRRAELADQRASIEAEVRDAFVDLQVANEQVTLAGSNRKLASDTLQQSQDRFAVGVADSVEVVNSQQALAAADHDYVTSLFSQRIARITLARAMGEAEQRLPEVFERKTP